MFKIICTWLNNRRETQSQAQYIEGQKWALWELTEGQGLNYVEVMLESPFDDVDAVSIFDKGAQDTLIKYVKSSLAPMQFSVGDDYLSDGADNTTAGINVTVSVKSMRYPYDTEPDTWGNRIEVYGHNLEKAAELRTAIIHTLKAHWPRTVRELLL